jgi:MarR family transcriptional regulator, organic hydroperoxide resistance regulator
MYSNDVSRASETAETVATLMRAADLVRRQMNAVVEPHGLTLQQFNVLRILRGGGSDGVPTLEVAERMIEKTPGITRLLDRLEAKELIRRQRCPRDRRQHLCWITPKGLAVLQKMDAPIARTHEETLKGLRARDRAAFTRLLGAMHAAHE